MKFVLLLPFFVATTLALNSKSVNVALQTSFVFDPKTSGKDISFISNLRKFLSKIERYISPKNSMLRSSDESKHLLSDFLRDIAEILLNYKDDEFNDFVKALDGEMEEYYYKGTVFHQIVFAPKLKLFIRNSIKEWAVTDPKELKNLLILCSNSTNTTWTNFAVFLDSFYSLKDQEELNSLIADLTKTKPLEDQSEIIKEALKFIVFDRYEKLNYTSKAKLAEEVGKLTEYVAKNFESKVKDADAIFRTNNYKRYLVNDTFPLNNKNNITERKEPYAQANAVENLRSNPKVIKEIVLNKNFDIDVRRADSDAVKKELEEVTTGAATIIFRSDDNPGVTSVVNLADLLWENGPSTEPDSETLNFKLNI